MNNTKVKILGEDSFELEGSEDFVTKHLEEFRNLLVERPSQDNPPKTQKQRQKRKAMPKSGNTEEVQSGQETKGKPRSKAKAKKVTATRFDIHGGGEKQSLKDFLAEKKPGKANGVQIAVIGYYITEILGEDSFSEGQVEYAYKMLGIKRPNHPHQIMINNKNEKDYYEQIEGEESNWRLTRSGEIFVADQLPGESE